jgi:hypothetical protein
MKDDIIDESLFGLFGKDGIESRVKRLDSFTLENLCAWLLYKQLKSTMLANLVSDIEPKPKNRVEEDLRKEYTFGKKALVGVCSDKMMNMLSTAILEYVKKHATKTPEKTNSHIQVRSVNEVITIITPIVNTLIRETDISDKAIADMQDKVLTDLEAETDEKHIDSFVDARKRLIKYLISYVMQVKGTISKELKALGDFIESIPWDRPLMKNYYDESVCSQLKPYSFSFKHGKLIMEDAVSQMTSDEEYAAMKRFVESTPGVTEAEAIHAIDQAKRAGLDPREYLTIDDLRNATPDSAKGFDYENDSRLWKEYDSTEGVEIFTVADNDQGEAVIKEALVDAYGEDFTPPWTDEEMSLYNGTSMNESGEEELTPAKRPTRVAFKDGKIYALDNGQGKTITWKCIDGKWYSLDDLPFNEDPKFLIQYCDDFEFWMKCSPELCVKWFDSEVNDSTVGLPVSQVVEDFPQLKAILTRSDINEIKQLFQSELDAYEYSELCRLEEEFYENVGEV